MRTYFFHRLARIVPLYYLALIIFLFLVPTFSGLASDYRFESPRLSLWLFISNYFSEPGVFGHCWSLAIEMQFYAIWPFALTTVGRRAGVALCVGVFASSLAVRAVQYSNDMAWSSTYRWTASHLDGLAVGSLLGIVSLWPRAIERLKRPAWGVLLVAAPLGLMAWKGHGGLVFHSAAKSALHFAVRVLAPTGVALFYGALLVVAVSGGMRKILAGPVQTALARYSYGMYVYHFLMTPFFFTWFSGLRERIG